MCDTVYDEKAENEINLIIIDALLKVHNEFLRISKRPLNYGTEHLVYRSEIHMIDFIGRHPDLSISELSEELGVSISAVSQLVAKLHKRNFLVKQQYKKEVRVHLTDEGLSLFKGHEEYHQTQNQYSVFLDRDKYPLIVRKAIAAFIQEYACDIPKR